MAVASAGLYASLHLIPDNHTDIPPLSFLQAECPSCRSTNSVKAHPTDVDDADAEVRRWSATCLPTYGIAVTVLGVVLLDCCCDACQSPCRTYLLDVSQPQDHAAGLATFTVMAGLGGSVGYLFGGVVDWQTTGLGSSLGGHVQVRSSSKAVLSP